MQKNIKLVFLWLLISASFKSFAQTDTTIYHEQYRPQVHFSPQAHWMNDPNGMVYYNGIYHLFFQYFPGGTTWGPMHWGHAESRDMIHWKQLPTALYPDSLGYIFSGSAVVDSNNTSGFGKNGKIPLVAIFTNHDPKGERAGRNDFQNESLAYSLDNGATWTKYSGNPVLKNPGIRDFRDPKVIWYAPEHKWIMTLATQDHITFYSSSNLKTWIKESEFGKQLGAHGGVWECPDLISLKLNGKTYWVLIMNVNPGGPNGGSATQYFVGHFNGNIFTPVDKEVKWVDYGPDEYAGVTWCNTGTRKIFLGWMSNWEYAGDVPTVKWRNAMTIPRELKLKNVNGKVLLSSEPVNELSSIYGKPHIFTNINLNKSVLLSDKVDDKAGPYLLKIKINQLKNFQVKLSNSKNEVLLIGYDSQKKQYYIDRTHSGKITFNKNFPGKFVAPRLVNFSSSDITILVDNSSVELFADNGLTVMSCVFFPNEFYRNLALSSIEGTIINSLKFVKLKSIWPR
ncbi:glycoside hydrolase family 32 protein [Mucilaginibacter sp.]